MPFKITSLPLIVKLINRKTKILTIYKIKEKRDLQFNQEVGQLLNKDNPKLEAAEKEIAKDSKQLLTK
jgi:hypothetical protein